MGLCAWGGKTGRWGCGNVDLSRFGARSLAFQAIGLKIPLLIPAGADEVMK